MRIEFPIRRPPWSRAIPLLAGLLAVACGDAPPQAPPPVRVQVAKAGAQALPQTIASVGSFESPDMTTVASEINGRVVELDVPEGRRVAAGQLLARLDDAEARASLRQARARLTNARDRLERLKKLRKQSVSSQQAYEDALSAFDAADGAYREARTRLDKTTIMAPFAGVLGLRQVNVGQVVESGTPLVEISQVDPLELRFSVPQRHAGRVEVGQAVRGRVGSCGDSFEGEVQAIDPRVDPNTRHLHLQARVQNPEGRLYPGMAVSLRLVVGEIPDAIVVPQESIVRQGTKHIVWVLDAENRAEQRIVELGQFFVDGVHVTKGLAVGTPVVSAGHQKLRPGAQTEPLPFEPVDNPNLLLGRFGPEGSCDPIS